MPYNPQEEKFYDVSNRRPNEPSRWQREEAAQRSKQWTVIHDLDEKEYVVYGEGEYIGKYPEKHEDEMNAAIFRADAEMRRNKDRLDRQLAVASPIQSIAPPTKRHISRRTVLTSLGGLAALAGLAGGSWLVLFPRPLYVYRGHSSIIRDIAWSPNGTRIASASDDGTVQIWDATTGGNVLTYRGHSSGAISLSWSSSGKHIASCGFNDTSIHIWDAASGRRIFAFRSQSVDLYYPIWSSDDTRIACAGSDNTIQVWNASGGHHILTFHAHSTGKYASIESLTWSPDSRYIASVENFDIVQIWNVLNGRNVFTYQGQGQVWSGVWSPDGRYIAFANSRGPVEVLDVSTWRTIYTYHNHSNLGYNRCLTWSPDSKRLASFDDNSLQVWNILNGDNVFTCHGKFDYALIWSPNGKFIASIAGRTINLFNFLSGYPDYTVEVWQAP